MEHRKTDVKIHLFVQFGSQYHTRIDITVLIVGVGSAFARLCCLILVVGQCGIGVPAFKEELAVVHFALFAAVVAADGKHCIRFFIDSKVVGGADFGTSVGQTALTGFV